MRLISLIIATLTPACAHANCAAEMRLCTIAPADNDLAVTQACGQTQCALADVVFDIFRFADGSYIRIDYFAAETLMTGQIDFVSTLMTDGGADPLTVIEQARGPDQRSFASDEFGAFFTDPCDERCAGIDPDLFGN